MVPHLLVAATLLGAFVLGTLLGHHREPAVVSAALLAALQSLALVLTSLRTWPAPFDAALRDRAALRPDL